MALQFTIRELLVVMLVVALTVVAVPTIGSFATTVPCIIAMVAGVAALSGFHRLACVVGLAVWASIIIDSFMPHVMGGPTAIVRGWCYFIGWLVVMAIGVSAVATFVRSRRP